MDPVQAGSEIPKCPKCGWALEDGWCRRCSDRRQRLWVIALVVVLPALGFMTCSMAGSEPGSGLSGAVGMAGALVCILSPIAGAFYALGAFVSSVRRRRK